MVAYSDTQMRRKVYLEGDELEVHLAAEQEAADLLAKQQAALERSRRMLHADAGGESDSDSDSDGDDDGARDEEADAAEEAARGEGEPAALRRRRIGGFTGGAGAWDEFLDAEALAGLAGGQSFDIYVRGAFGVRAGGGGSGLQRFRMFPVVERRRRVDAYGEAIDVEGWLRRGQEEDPLAPGADQQVLGKRPREDEPEPVPEVHPSPSSSLVLPVFEVLMRCSLARRRSPSRRTSTSSTESRSTSSRSCSSSTWRA